MTWFGQAKHGSCTFSEDTVNTLGLLQLYHGGIPGVIAGSFLLFVHLGICIMVEYLMAGATVTLDC